MRNPTPWLAALTTLALVGCRGSGTDEDSTSPAVAAATNEPAPESVQLEVIDLKLGRGAIADSGSTVTVHYALWSSGTRRTDTRETRWVDDDRTGRRAIGGEPRIFQLGTDVVPFGFDEGLRGMRVGGKRRVIVAPGYGSPNRSPQDETLVFEVELLGVK